MVITTSNIPFEAKRVWTTLITNTAYLPGLLALDFSLKKVNSAYSLVALYTDTFSKEGHAALDCRGIPKIYVPYLLPTSHKDYSNDIRFYDCWSKLQPFGLTQFERIVQLDSDMIVLKNMDELMDLPLNETDRLFAATHACVCNPYNKAHYPKDWVRDNCAYTNYNQCNPEGDYAGPDSTQGLGICNGGLQVVAPSQKLHQSILAAISSPSQTDAYDFADQSLLSDVFNGKWLALSYKYNALKTLKLTHEDIWKEDEIKNIHYIISPKPWDVVPELREIFNDETDTFKYWWRINDERLRNEHKRGVNDGF
ncbi:nucleotide-diphospho-sugar transferase [Nadsonia fulvescens var. elongata DSM 6958]|uniref:Nucleotide-diphospho-sugar transferase n=1 Tax=Nadsonia fulvescens var. elongata DSM 6958 TaxID=857566 RepID=A0A1E3PSG5_9ASCO|nr:nucleotide-diphospho-sugar transferase [Nadsonia fulvescens var. elongata DSM 6958]